MASSTSAAGFAAVATCLVGGSAFVAPSSGPALRASHFSAAGAASSSDVPSSSSSSAALPAAAMVGVLAAAGLLRKGVAGARARPAEKHVVALRSLKSDPGFNTLPEWDRPKNGFEGLVGDQPPLGLWDPLGFTKDRDVEKFKRRREIELKHGRVAMFATIGYITPEYFKWPGFLSTSANLQFADVPNGMKALSVVPTAGIAQFFAFVGFNLQFADVPNGMKALSVVPTAGIAQFFAFVGFIELVYNKSYGEPGNYGKGLFGLGSLGLSATVSDPKTRDKKLRAEISNGRLAMMATIGMFFQDGLTGSAWGDWALYTASPLRAFESELGVQQPTGFWDPLGFSKDGDASNFRRRRVTEIKHGRVAMLATMGYITPEFFKFPGYLSTSENLRFADIPNGLAAISKVPGAGWLQIVAYGLYCEGTGGFGYNSDNQMSDPGNCGWKPPLLATSDPEKRTKRLNAELANGRLAMMAIIGMFVQDGLTGSAWGDWALYTASPMRAFENEMGVQAPLGFFDPIGYTKDGSSENFNRRRQSEIKHGRIAMMATMGYITPELVGKLPGYCSISQNLKFADIPNGLAAISKVPSAGWAQILAYMSFCEISGDQSKGSPGAAGDFGFKVLTSSDPATKTKKLNSELANGRLAMMAIIGMFFQDGLTGSAYGDWALYTDSPLRAFESELGVQDPVGFWDPLSLTADGDVASFRRRRAVELKHGRISMLATMGYITPEVTGKFPGYLSQSAGLKFADVPNGLSAISKVPAIGWAQVIAYAGFCEISAGTDDFKSPSGVPGDYGFKVLTSSIAEEKNKKLSAEIANGRLAMMAIIGMFFQDGLTGSAWGDWSLYTSSPLRV
eukprot:CAMPEP_0183484804 /NCGR_PEP_ID=MMETSP0370-20130417/179107_1 /TAXON_ID=268820 /ORGANISM="Peridinium aciculiferum, Strain PAER-2" /LENGTH=847 /DNA_ID=CAMNT_0025678097 /DNA_START=117 /DNA_END=2660 /DNA_ORIENTATION=-